MPARYVASTTVLNPPGSGLVATDPGPDIAPDGSPYTAVLLDGGCFHYFHFMETLIWLRSIQDAFLGGQPPARIVISTDWDDPRLNGIGRRIMGVLYPGIPLSDVRNPWPEYLGHTLILGREWAEMRVNKYLEAAMGFADTGVVAMAAAVRHATGAYQVPAQTGRILYVPRQNADRRLQSALETALLDHLQKLAPCSAVDFAILPWDQQVRQAAAHDVMIGVHGNGLTNALWMRPGSTLIELFCAGTHHYDYQFFAELAGLNYVGLDGDTSFHGGRRYGDAYGHAINNTQIEFLRMDLIDAIITGKHASASF